MKIIRNIMMIGAVLAMTATVGCDNTKSYADLLNQESRATNAFLVNQRVESQVPADTVFQTGPDAPYYQIDDEGTMFMQVLNPGTPGNRAEVDQLIYFRFTRFSLYAYSYDISKKGQPGYYGDFGSGEGNDSDLAAGSYSFRYSNMSASSSYQWGKGLQAPLNFLPIDCEVNLVIKSQSGLYNEIASVTPYLYKIRYFKSQI